jgi:hypothetical protein
MLALRPASAECAMAEAVDYPAWIVARGGEGMGRAQIAASMRMSLQRLKAWEAADAAIAQAMREAETAAQAWWEELQCEALTAGARINAAAWRAAMEWRFGDPKSRAAAAMRAPLARYEIPDNGKERRPRSGRR